MRYALLVIAMAMTAQACSTAAADQDPLLAALCEATAAPDAVSAGEVFDARAHTPLHAVADEVAAVDRALATRLLEAKFAVEAVVGAEEPAPAALVTERLDALTDVTREALTTLDRPAPAC